MHARDAIQHRSQDVVAVLLQMTRAVHIHHQKRAVGPQGLGNALEHGAGMRLVVDGIKGGDEVVAADLVELGRILDGQLGIGEALLLRFRPARSDAFFREVIACKAALRKRFRHEIDRMATSTSDVEDVNACA